jgi:uncharacterized membrane protein YeiB
MENFWKLFSTLFGSGVAISFAKSLRSKKRWQEVLSEMIITGFLATCAGLIYLQFPNAPIIAIAAAAAMLAILGTAFLGEKIETAIDRSIDKFIGKKDGT